MAKKSKTVKTKAPSGLKLVRSNSTFTLSWKIGDSDYADGQYFSYLIDDVGADSWTGAAKIGVKATSKAISINANSYYPKTSNYLYKIGMRVKGNRKKYTKKGKTYNPGVSDWSSKEYTLQVPNNPSVSVAPDEELTNVCVFSWSVSQDSSSAQMFTDVEYQHKLFKNTKETDGSKLDWSGATVGTGGASDSRTITEDSSILYQHGDSYVRWFRVRARGPRGASAWRYSYRVYAIPYQANVTSAFASETEAGGFQCTANWTAENNRQYPIEKVTVQYVIATPTAGLNCPSGASWSEVDISQDTEGADSATFSIDDQLSVDQCLFIRVNTHYGKKITYGKPQLAKVGYLKNPENLSVEVSVQTHKAIVSANNRSDVEDSVLVVRYLPAEGEAIDVGIIPHGSSQITVQCPDWTGQGSPAFGVHALVGTYTKQTRTDNVDVYTINEKMRSEGELTQGGAVPMPPENVTVNRVEGLSNTVQVKWDWSWAEANSAEISWADHIDAWESTDEPESYIVSNLHASQWNIANLATGQTWYIRVRLLIENQDNITYGPWSDIDQGIIDLSSAPNKPLLMLSDAVISQEGTLTASWVYTTTDKTPQSYAEVVVVQMNDTEVQTEDESDMVIHDTTTDTDTYIEKDRTYGNIVAHSLTAQHVTISALEAGWTQGNVYNLACRVKSESGKFSEWSNVVSVTIAEPLICQIAQSSLVPESETQTSTDIETGEEITVTREFLSLKEMPMTVTVTGAGVGGITTVAIERAADYKLTRPNEDESTGYEGETIALFSQVGESQITFKLGNLIGSLDDGAQYRLVATVKDGLGQNAKASQDFEVHWEHQAIIPLATFEVDEEDSIVKITPTAPSGSAETDVADIYRLSIDKPELIVKGAQFGVTYVDPYPALGDMGGHRVVLRTENGDYITQDNMMAFVDSTDMDGATQLLNPEQWNIIDFEGKQIKFYWDTDYSNTWAKDFQETQYLGGSIQGDWNAAVSRSGTLSTQAITVLDQDMLQVVRRLATYPGICHVRTADGSSYAADIQVSEDRVHDDQEMVANYSLAITRVDSQGFDGMTLEQWQSETEEPQEVNDGLE